LLSDNGSYTLLYDARYNCNMLSLCTIYFINTTSDIFSSLFPNILPMSGLKLRRKANLPEPSIASMRIDFLGRRPFCK